MNNTSKDRIAVCSWSLHPASPQDLAAKVKQTGISQVQLALDPLRDSPAVWGQTQQVLAAESISIASGMMGCVGEDYTTLDTIRMTGGVAPDGTWQQNLKNASATALLARKLGLDYVTFHAGFIPHDPKDPALPKMVDRLKQIAQLFAEQSINLGFETGQERATDLLHVLQTLSKPNIAVNFDPANMILYDKGNPIEALKLLGKYVRHVHIKDATRTKVPGTWGSEVVVGTGEVDWKAFFATLKQFGFKGHYVIEREAGNQRVEDIKTARALVQKLTAEGA